MDKACGCLTLVLPSMRAARLPASCATPHSDSQPMPRHRGSDDYSLHGNVPVAAAGRCQQQLAK